MNLSFCSWWIIAILDLANGVKSHQYELGHVQQFCPKKKGRLSHGTVVAEEDDSRRSGGAFTTPTFTGGAWLVDSRASSHMTPNKEYFASYKMFDKHEKVHLGGG